MAIQLRDAGNVSAIAFRNISLTARHDVATWWGSGEAASVSRLRRVYGQQHLGTLEDVTFTDIRAVAESGIVIVGEDTAAVGSVKLQDVSVQLRRLSKYPGGIYDLRPGVDGRRHAYINALHVDNVNSLLVDVRPAAAMA